MNAGRGHRPARARRMTARARGGRPGSHPFEAMSSSTAIMVRTGTPVPPLPV